MEYPPTLIEKYGCKEILQSLIDVIKILETSGVTFLFEGKNHRNSFHDSSDNLATHALQGFFCTFSKVQKCCRYCHVSKDELKKHPDKKGWLFRSKDSYSSITTT